MKQRSLGLLLFLAVAVVVPAAATKAAAQTCANNAPVCIGTDGRIIIAPPSATVTTDPNARARADYEAQMRAAADARARADYEARMRAAAGAQLSAEISRIARWDFYLNWRARVESDVWMKLRADAERSGQGSGGGGALAPLMAVGPRVITFGRLEWSLATVCVAVFTGPDLPAYTGPCLPFRYRFDPSWSILFDGSFLFERYRDASFQTIGAHPALAYSFAEGHGSLAGSHAFVRAGFDVQVPVSGRSASPDVFVGGHIGIGVHAQVAAGGGVGIELRGLARGGTSTADDGVARARLGAELRIHLLTLTW